MSGRRDRYTFITPTQAPPRPHSSFFPDDDSSYEPTFYPTATPAHVTPTSDPIRHDVEMALMHRLEDFRSALIATAEREGWSSDVVDELLASVGLPKWTKEWRVVTRTTRDDVTTVRAVSEAAATQEVDANTPSDVSVVSVVQAEEIS